LESGSFRRAPSSGGRAVATLRDAEIPYIIIEAKHNGVPAGTVFQHSPAGRTGLYEDMAVALLASR
jgi:hypothetical protein